MKVIKTLLYTKNHEWVRVEGDEAYIGITDYAQHSMGDIVYVETPELDDEVKASEYLGVVESVKAASDIYAPISGKVIEINEQLEDTPESINESPYDAYIVKLSIANKSELDDLFNGDDYEVYCNEIE
jgi:glycine cleavage system H protein